MTQHTPGPWIVGSINIYNDNAKMVASAHPHGCGNSAASDYPQVLANARLIAAAPKLDTVANSFEIKGPDADGLLWLVLTDPESGNRAAFNLGRAEHGPDAGDIAANAALGLEKFRRAAIAKAEGDTP